MTIEKLDSTSTGNQPLPQSNSDVGRIETHINQTIATEGMAFEVSLDEQILKITVKTDQLLEAETLAKSIRDELLKLKLTNISLVQLHKQKLRRGSGYKLNEFTLIQEAKPTSVKPEMVPGNVTGNAPERRARPQPQTQPIERQNFQQSAPQKPIEKINQTRQIFLLLLLIVLAIFGVWLTITRLSRWIMSPFGFIGALIGLPLLFKYYGMLYKIWQALVEEKQNYG
jgi:hypothetical protein